MTSTIASLTMLAAFVSIAGVGVYRQGKRDAERDRARRDRVPDLIATLDPNLQIGARAFVNEIVKSGGRIEWGDDS